MLISFGVVFLGTENHLLPCHYITAGAGGQDEKENGKWNLKSLRNMSKAANT
nr:MAG TPA: hypothetical protein [Caudoviricetes sp.]